MRCPICDKRCSEDTRLCTTCFFPVVNKVFCSQLEKEKWYKEVVEPYKKHFSESIANSTGMLGENDFFINHMKPVFDSMRETITIYENLTKGLQSENKLKQSIIKEEESKKELQNNVQIEEKEELLPKSMQTDSEDKCALSIGDVFEFGRYKDKNINWIILDKKDDRVLLLSQYALDCQKYNASYKNVTWENCTLRKWLNSEFLNEAFDSDAQKSIISSEVIADINPIYRTLAGNDTIDKIFLLSINEVYEYFASDDERKCEATNYAEEQDSYMDEDNGCCWWLRSPGFDSRSAANVNGSGAVDESGYRVNFDPIAVRPALWLNVGTLFQ